MASCSSEGDCARFTGLCLNQTCACFEVFGASGPDCNVPSAVSGGSAGLLALAAACVTAFVVYDSRTLINMLLSTVKVFKFNLAGRVFAFGWTALFATWVGSVVAVAAPFANLLVPVLCIDFLAIVCQIYALINLIVGFLKFSMIRNMSQKAFYREYSAIILILVVALFVLVLIFTPFSVASYVAGAVFFLTTTVAAIAPYALFLSAMTTRTQCSRFRILMVALEDSLLHNDAIHNFIGMWDESRSSLTRQSLELKRNSRGELIEPKDWAGSFDSSMGSRSASFFDFKLTSNGSFIVTKDQALSRPGSNGSVYQVTTDKQRKKSEFFQRSIHTGNALLLSGLGVCGFWLVFALFLPLEGQPRTDFALTALFWALRAICLGTSEHIVVKFSSHVYEKNIKNSTQDRKSRKQLVQNNNNNQSKDTQTAGDSPERTATSWLIQNTNDCSSARPLSTKKLVVALEDQHNHQALVGKGGSNHSLNPKMSGRRLVDEESDRLNMRPASTAMLTQEVKAEVNTSGVFSVKANGVIDHYIDDDDDDE